MDKLEISTCDYFALNGVLVKMVLNGLLTNKEREDFLYKSKLLKLENNQWKDMHGSILNLISPETK